MLNKIFKFLMNNNVLAASIVFFSIVYVMFYLSLDFFQYINTIFQVVIFWLVFLIPLYWIFFAVIHFRESKIILTIFTTFFIIYFFWIIKMGIFSSGFEAILEYLGSINQITYLLSFNMKI